MSMTFGTVSILLNWADGLAGHRMGLLRVPRRRVPQSRAFRFCWSKRAALLLAIQRLISLELQIF